MPPRRWWAEDPRQDGSVIFRCLQCNEQMPFPNLRLCRKYHWPGKSKGDPCQGQIARLRGEADLRNQEVLVMFGPDDAPQPHDGRVVYEVPSLIYQGRGRVQTMWTVQFEDGEEFELNYDEIRAGIAWRISAPPQNAIRLPVDDGVEGRPGALVAPPQDISDSDYEEWEDDDIESGGDEDDMDVLSGSDDELGPEDWDYLAQPVAPGRETNILTHILRTLQDRRGPHTNQSVVRGFIRIREDFGTELPKTWDSLLNVLKVIHFPCHISKPINGICYLGD